MKTDINGDTIRTRSYGGNYNEIGRSGQQTSDGGYVIVGSTRSYGQGTPTYTNIYLVKTDTNGDTIWTRVFGDSGFVDDYAYDITQTSDGGYIIAGYTELPNVYHQDFYLVKTDAYGNTIWTKVYPKAYHSDVPYQIQQTNDKGYIIVGYTHYWYFGEPRAYEQIYVIKTNPAGGIEEHHTGCKKTSFKIIPNPVVGGAIIEYGIPRSTLLTITNYNSLG